MGNHSGITGTVILLPVVNPLTPDFTVKCTFLDSVMQRMCIKSESNIIENSIITFYTLLS